MYLSNKDFLAANFGLKKIPAFEPQAITDKLGDRASYKFQWLSLYHQVDQKKLSAQERKDFAEIGGKLISVQEDEVTEQAINRFIQLCKKGLDTATANTLIDEVIFYLPQSASATSENLCKNDLKSEEKTVDKISKKSSDASKKNLAFRIGRCRALGRTYRIITLSCPVDSEQKTAWKNKKNREDVYRYVKNKFALEQQYDKEKFAALAPWHQDLVNLETKILGENFFNDDNPLIQLGRIYGHTAGTYKTAYQQACKDFNKINKFLTREPKFSKKGLVTKPKKMSAIIKTAFLTEQQIKLLNENILTHFKQGDSSKTTSKIKLDQEKLKNLSLEKIVEKTNANFATWLSLYGLVYAAEENTLLVQPNQSTKLLDLTALSAADIQYILTSLRASGLTGQAEALLIFFAKLSQRPEFKLQLRDSAIHTQNIYAWARSLGFAVEAGLHYQLYPRASTAPKEHQAGIITAPLKGKQKDKVDESEEEEADSENESLPNTAVNLSQVVNKLNKQTGETGKNYKYHPDTTTRRRLTAWLRLLFAAPDGKPERLARVSEQAPLKALLTGSGKKIVIQIHHPDRIFFAKSKIKQSLSWQEKLKEWWFARRRKDHHVASGSKKIVKKEIVLKKERLQALQKKTLTIYDQAKISPEDIQNLQLIRAGKKAELQAYFNLVKATEITLGGDPIEFNGEAQAICKAADKEIVLTQNTENYNIYQKPVRAGGYANFADYCRALELKAHYTANIGVALQAYMLNGQVLENLEERIVITLAFPDLRTTGSADFQRYVAVDNKTKQQYWRGSAGAPAQADSPTGLAGLEQLTYDYEQIISLGILAANQFGEKNQAAYSKIALQLLVPHAFLNGLDPVKKLQAKQAFVQAVVRVAQNPRWQQLPYFAGLLIQSPDDDVLVKQTIAQAAQLGALAIDVVVGNGDVTATQHFADKVTGEGKKIGIACPTMPDLLGPTGNLALDPNRGQKAADEGWMRATLGTISVAIGALNAKLFKKATYVPVQATATENVATQEMHLADCSSGCYAKLTALRVALMAEQSKYVAQLAYPKSSWQDDYKKNLQLYHHNVTTALQQVELLLAHWQLATTPQTRNQLTFKDLTGLACDINFSAQVNCGKTLANFSEKYLTADDRKALTALKPPTQAARPKPATPVGKSARPQQQTPWWQFWDLLPGISATKADPSPQRGREVRSVRPTAS